MKGCATQKHAPDAELSSFCIFNDVLLFCIKTVFLKPNTPPALPACMQPFEKTLLLSLYFSYKSTTDTHGNSQFSSWPPSLVSDPSGGCIHSAGPCLPSIMQSLMDSTEGRRQGLLDHWKHHQSQPLLLLLFLPWIHLCPRMNSCFVTEQAHTHK